MNLLLIRHERLSALQQRQLLDIKLRADQKSLVGDVHGALHALTARPGSDIQGFALVVDDVPRGFFLLKRRSLLPRWATGLTATFHALMIDRDFQGLGLGRRCVQMLPGVAQKLWPEITQLMLAVALENLAAHSLYRGLGWQDDGDADRSKAGFERRMVLNLNERGGDSFRQTDRAN